MINPKDIKWPDKLEGEQTAWVVGYNKALKDCKHFVKEANNGVEDCKKLNPERGLVELDEDAIAICRETVGYLLVKANEIKNINANNWVTFKKRAIALENLIEFSQNFGSKRLPTVEEIEKIVKSSDLYHTAWNYHDLNDDAKQAEQSALYLTHAIHAEMSKEG